MISQQSALTVAGNVQIIFDGFNEYNFYIDVCGTQYEAVQNGLDLVEQEMPASISFHVPDQYHKRIIGIGGQHIQRIMKKYSVFVKFSNAMDRGGLGKDEDDVKVDNVICRTPARNAQSLDLVKQEIMDMVEKVVCSNSARYWDVWSLTDVGCRVRLRDGPGEPSVPPRTAEAHARD